MGLSKTSDHVQIKIKMPNLSEEPPVSSKAPNEDLKTMDVLCTFKIMIKSLNSDQGYIKNQWPYPNQESSQEPPGFWSRILGLKGCGSSLHLQNQERDTEFETMLFQRPMTISKQDQDSKPNSGTSSVLQSPNWGLKEQGSSLHLQNQDREPKFGSRVYQRPVTISKSRSGCQTPVRNLQHPPKPQMRT